MNSKFVLLVIGCLFCYADAFNKVKLNDLESLEFRKNAETVGNYVRDQLTCEGELCDQYELDSVTCKNYGVHTGSDAWDCSINSSQVQFLTWSISCEIYPGTSPDERIIIDGSCSFDYELQLASLLAKAPHKKVLLF